MDKFGYMMWLWCVVYVSFQWQINDETRCVLLVSCIIVVKDFCLVFKYRFFSHCNEIILTMMCKSCHIW
jgi:hypothetical protein